MSTNMTGLRWFSKIFAFLSFETKVASALEELTGGDERRNRTCDECPDPYTEPLTQKPASDHVQS